MSTALKDKWVTIRKEQMCYSCYRKFPIGTVLRYWVCIYEGDFGAGYTCPTCDKIMDLSPEDDYEIGYAHECLNEGQTPEELLAEIIERRKIKHSEVLNGLNE